MLYCVQYLRLCRFEVQGGDAVMGMHCGCVSTHFQNEKANQRLTTVMLLPFCINIIIMRTRIRG